MRLTSQAQRIRPRQTAGRPIRPGETKPSPPGYDEHLVNVSRVAIACSLVAGAALAVPAPLAQSTRAAAPYTMLSADSRRSLAVVQSGGQDLLRLDELSDLFQLDVREDRRSNALTVTRRGKTIVLSLDQGLASIEGRLVSLPSAPVRETRGWLVPVDFVARALALISDTRIDVRKSSRLIVLGDLRVPRVVVRQEQIGTSTRLTFDLSPTAAYAVAQETGRLLVRFEVDALDASLIPGSGTGLVESVTAADPRTIAVNLGPRFGTYRASVVPGDAGAARIILDVAPAGAPQPARPQPVTPPPPAPSPALPFAPPAGPAIRTIVIDPGHGGDESGTQGPGGTLEKDVTLDVARRLRSLIEGRLGIRVLLTRDEDRFVPLDERTSIANNNKADLFVSIHANASPRRDARGAEVFYLSLDGYEGEARRMAERPPTRSLPTLGGGSREIELILWEMAQARHLSESTVFARFVEEELRRRVEMSARPLQQAPFRVLVGANMPAVLVEMGFLSSADQEASLRSEDFKASVAQALFDALLRYRARVQTDAPRTERPAPATTPEGRAPCP